MNRTAWIIFIVLSVGILAGLVYFSRGSTIEISDSTNLNAVIPASEESGTIPENTLGNTKAKVVVVEYADFQCPGCHTVSPAVYKAVTRHTDDVLLIFRNFPIPSLHPNARAAAAAAEAAGLQNKYWQYNELLFANQDNWKDLDGTERSAVFANYAQDIGLDVAQFNEDVDSDQVVQKIDFDVAVAKKAGVTGTPTVFVNGKKVDGMVKDGKLHDGSVEGGASVLTDADLFSEYILQPAIKAAQ